MRLLCLLKPKPKPRARPLLPPLSGITNPNPRHQWDRLCRQIATLEQFHQFLARAIVSGLFRNSRIPTNPTSPSPTSSSTKIQNPGIQILNSTLQALARSSSPEHVVCLYDLMRREGVSPDNYTFPFVFKAVGRLSLSRKGRELHSLSLKLGFGFDVFVQNSLIHMYFVFGMLEAARLVFDSLPDAICDVVSWNSVISGYLRSDLCEEALGVFGRMVESSVTPDGTTLVSALIACARFGAVNLGKRIHEVVLVNGFGLDCFLGSSLIDMYSKCGLIEDARRVFDRMPEKNVVSWTSMISGYAHSGQFKASIELFREMQIAKVKPDDATIACVVSACAHLGALDHGRWVHAYCGINGIGLNLKVKNALMDMYSKCGDTERALQIFHELVRPDVFSWTVMISGLAMNGCSNKALDLFSQMELLSEVVPNEITFLGVLSACSHGGLVEKGFYYFNCMTKIYKLIPKMQHFGCMVDLLGRAELLVELEIFIKNMPIKPDAVIWRSLLFACRNNGNVALAEFAVQRIMELKPRKCGFHVLLSNVYASVSRWSDVNLVRKDMNDWGIHKQPGCSFIEIDGIVHEFFAQDTLLCQPEHIHRMILGIDKLLQSEGYILLDTLD